jgi:phage shock protein PspC (stress-responsive transcriptional regulator)
MNKVININFQGRVIPIEEPAYEELKKYVESLRQYFANEEGKEEIINDIENRIAELFSEKLKINENAFISEAHVEAIIASIGRPEQFEEESLAGSADKERAYTNTSYSNTGNPGTAKESLYRNANEKILGGVCSGLAAYLKIDTTIIRVLFSLLAVGSFGFGLLLYVVLWVLLPERYLNAVVVTRKLYRDPEQKVLGGVCSGLAHYFNIQVWIPRLIFALPFIVGALENIFNWVHFSGAFTLPFGTFFLIYVILWAVVPKAVTASERLEMKGKKVDLESIKNKVKEEMQDVKENLSEKAGKWKNEFGSKAAEIGQEAKDSARKFEGEAGPAIKNSISGFVRFIVGVVKVFFLFIGGIIAISLIAASFGIIGLGTMIAPLKNFVVNSQSIQWYAWGTLILFILVPIVAIIQWIIRTIIGHKTKSPVIGITLGVLWFLGWVSVTMLVATISKQFRRVGSVKTEVALVQPSNGKLLVNFRDADGRYYPLDLNFGNEDVVEPNRGPFRLTANEDSLLLSNIRIKLEQSRDTAFHVSVIRMARATSPLEAEKIAAIIGFDVNQQDSVLTVPLSFPINSDTKFRNQQVIVEIQVPVGKEIYIDRKAEYLDWYAVKGGPKGISITLDDDWDSENGWRSGVWYIMKESGIEKKYKDQITDEDDMDEIERKLREEIKKENMKVEEMKIRMTDKDTSIEIKAEGITPRETEEEEEPAGNGKYRIGMNLLLSTMRLLKVNS